jgi:hypothetical protein
MHLEGHGLRRFTIVSGHAVEQLAPPSISIQLRSNSRARYMARSPVSDTRNSTYSFVLPCFEPEGREFESIRGRRLLLEYRSEKIAA